MVNFPGWLDEQLEKKSWSRADLSKHAKISQSALSLIYSGQRKIGPYLCEKIAKALRIPEVEVYRAAGLLADQMVSDDTLKRIEHIYNSLEDPQNRQRALDYIELLKVQEERAQYDARKPKATQPR